MRGGVESLNDNWKGIIVDCCFSIGLYFLKTVTYIINLGDSSNLLDTPP